MNIYIYRNVFKDPESMRAMLRGELPDIDDVRRRIFVSERQYDSGSPDYVIKNNIRYNLGKVSSVDELVVHVLRDLEKYFVVRQDGRLRIESSRFQDWQNLLPSISPLAVAVAFLVNEGKGPSFGEDPREYLVAELGSTALLSPFQPPLEAIVQRDGLNELHMHLNGSTEVDLIWCNAVMNPLKFRSTLLAELVANKDGSLKEFYDNLEVNLRPTELSRRLLSARHVRHIIAYLLRSGEGGSSHALDIFFRALRDPLGGREFPLSRPPAEIIFGHGEFEPLINEAAFLYSWLQGCTTISQSRRLLGIALYFQFLSQYSINVLSVQQQDQVGFDQFQKFTYVGVREDLEKDYSARFRQINRFPPYDALRHLEGRFAPKDNFDKLVGLIKKIVVGYLKFRGCPDAKKFSLFDPLPKCLHGGCGCDRSLGRGDSELSLVVHFIKAKEGPRPHPLALHGIVRNRLFVQARILVRARRFAGVREIVRGIDAAANELHTPPEVFGPVFRFLRSKGLDRATYHAGEDYIHLVSGIRATEEALCFLPLYDGDRIGHATALGILPSLWFQRFRQKITIEIGEHLDNLVYAFTRLAGKELAGEAFQCEKEIARLSQKIYGRSEQPSVLEHAWKMRQLDIMLILDLERDSGLDPGDIEIAKVARRVSTHTLDAARRNELLLIADMVEAYPASYWFARERHRRRSNLVELEEIDIDWISCSALEYLQSAVLNKFAVKRIAIEALPTSNLRISFYKKLSEHHIFRWLGLTDSGFTIMPDVCVGSDDTGIFSTNLYNEYALLYESLCRDFDMTPRDAAGLLEQINKNGFSHRFAPRAKY
jgi:adenosine deaminase